MAQPTSSSAINQTPWFQWLLIGGGLAIVVAAVAFQSRWLPSAQQFLARWQSGSTPVEPAAEAGHDEASHAAHGSPNSIELSPQARKNIGLTDDMIQPIKLQPFTRTITIPGMVVERPGRSILEVTAPFTGHIDRIYPIEGEAVNSGQKLFDLRLTHEELVQTQATLLQTAVDIEVIDKELVRLEKLSADGAIAGKRLIEQRNERGKKESLLQATRQALLLHGLDEAQVAGILAKKELFKELTITAREGHAKDVDQEILYQVQEIKVAQGQHVEAGATLAVLADHAVLYLEGEAFERDANDLNRVADTKAPVTAILESEGARSEVIEGLQILYLADKIDPATRTLDFYVTLPNKPQRDARLDNGRRFIAWKYRPGQRMQLEIPLETLPDRIVLPVDAIAQEGTETYVFTPNGNQWVRRSVHVEYRDQRHAVIANDGALFPGDRVALTGAQQLQVAIKNKSGGAIDPHAGHSH
jgi:multidrug efflux pump subunit AcrA (membrane-fusion protein)